MSRALTDLSPDARTLLRLIGRRHGMGGHFRTGDVASMHPRHDGDAADMTVPEITAALRQLSQLEGWLGTFRPGLYVFRAYAQWPPGADADTAVRGAADRVLPPTGPARSPDGEVVPV